VAAEVLPRPIVVAKVFDRITGNDKPVRSAVIGAERSAETEDWTTLRDWELVQRLNALLANIGTLRKACTPSDDAAAVGHASNIAITVIEREIPQLKLSFRVPTIDSIAVFWPGSPITATTGSIESDQEPVDLV
jgi:hypothetical protein